MHSIGDQVIEALRIHRRLRKRQATARTIEMLRLVGIPAPEQRLFDYPHQFSGGMRQRVMIAMALSCDPALLIADEPTTALDVTIQAQILELIRELSRRTGTAVIIITHDLGVVAELAHRVVVMYAGRVVEQATTAELFAGPRHPYTRALLGSIPNIEQQRGARLTPIAGTVPDPLRLPPGCAFAPRCEFAGDPCRRGTPPLLAAGAGRLARCLLHDPATAAALPAAARATLLDPAPVDGTAPSGVAAAVRTTPGGTAAAAHRDGADRGAGAAPFVRVRDLVMHFPVTAGVFRHVVGYVRAVDGVSFHIKRAETLGLVGESGCGKSGVRRAGVGARRVDPGADPQSAARPAARSGTDLPVHHDLSVVRHISDRVAVMYLVQIVEQADADSLFARPAHPYTQALLSAVPAIEPGRRRQRVVLSGDVPSAAAPPPGCRFHTRCPYAQPQCRDQAPELATVPDAPGHQAACHIVSGAIKQAPRTL